MPSRKKSPHKAESPRLVSIRELCARLNISRACVYKENWTRLLPPRRKFGRRSGYLAHEVDAFILSLPTAPGTGSE